MSSAAPEVSCARFDLDLAARVFGSFPDVGLARGVELSRARGEFGARSASDVSARVAVIGLRSGGAQGYVGVAGDALVPVLEVAEARWDWRATGLAVAGGLVDDLWAVTVEDGWGEPAVAPAMALTRGFLDRSDVGGWASWTAPGRELTATVGVSSGEGARAPERNEGLNLEARLALRPNEVVALAAFAREGSVGILSARDHRLGGAVHAESPWVRGGFDVLLGLGLQGDATLAPLGASAYALAGGSAPFAAWLRGDLTYADRKDPASQEAAVELGGGPVLAREPRFVLAAGYEARRYAENAAPVAGTQRVTGSDTFFLQMGTRWAGGGDLP
jgi:hypothetical protein